VTSARRWAWLAGWLCACSGGPPPPAADAPILDGPTPAVSPEEPEPPVAPEKNAVDDGWLDDLLEANPDKFGTLLADPAKYRWQILVTLVTPDEGGAPTLEDHGFREGAEFIYPASSIKTFASVVALRKLQELRASGHPVTVDTPLALCKGSSTRCRSTVDDTNVEGGTITLGHEIRKMQLVSDNRSFNRLYNFIGHREFNEAVWALGFPEVRIHHRMFDTDDPAVRRATPGMELRPAGARPVVVPHRRSDLELPPTNAPRLAVGTAYLGDGKERVGEPMSFAEKNYASIRDLHRLTMSLVMPGAPGTVDLGLTEEHRRFLLDAMTEDPHASSNPVYTEPSHSGLRYKTMIRGMMRVLPLSRIQYTGKPGRAFGFHLDSAYIEDTKTHKAMFVTTVVYANENGVLNDNEYQHDEITRPYLKDLGEVLVQAWFS
jgi:hypothetical protein